MPQLSDGKHCLGWRVSGEWVELERDPVPCRVSRTDDAVEQEEGNKIPTGIWGQIQEEAVLHVTRDLLGMLHV